jgi:ribosomal protein S27AE
VDRGLSLREDGGVESFTCPRCGMTSHHPDDARDGYCGNCHDWTRIRDARPNVSLVVRKPRETDVEAT